VRFRFPPVEFTNVIARARFHTVCLSFAQWITLAEPPCVSFQSRLQRIAKVLFSGTEAGVATSHADT